MNFKIFPATLTRDRRKVPLINGWKELATNDPNQIKIWQDQFRDRITFWGINTGTTNDILVLDIDGDGLKTIQEKHLIIPDTLCQRTLSGGLHYFFKRPNDTRRCRNRVKFLPGLDIRGDEGWAAYYGFLDPTKPLAEAPNWLIEESLKEDFPSVSGPAQASSVTLAPEIARGILEGCLDSIRNAPQGERNNTLNTQAFKIGQLIASQNITRDVAEQEVIKAAQQAGLTAWEIKATMKSGLDGGSKNPLVSPFPNTPPVAAFEIPAVPGLPERWTPKYFTKADLLNRSKLRKPQLFTDWSTEDIHVTTADGGTGKTTLKLYEAICLALGDRFLGFEPKQVGKTLFITGEDTDVKLAAMLGAIMQQMGIIDDEAKVNVILNSIVIKKDSDLCLITKDKQGFLTVNQDAVRKLTEAVDDIRPKMIVWDPIASFWGAESMVNDMNRAVIKFMSWLAEYSGACVEMINHLGKVSSKDKDMSMFAGRGGTGLVSNSRVSRTLRGIDSEEYYDLTGSKLEDGESAILCNVNKFSDGSPLLNQPFVIVRKGYLFDKKELTPQKIREVEQQTDDKERVFEFIHRERLAKRYPTIGVTVAEFMVSNEPLSEARVKRAIKLLGYGGHQGYTVKETSNPDPTIRDKALIIFNSEGKEI